jgi:hypothetical protein
MKHGRMIAATASAGVVVGSVFLGVPAASAHPSGTGKPMTPPGQTDQNPGQAKTVELNAVLSQLNFSGASGTATATVRNQKIRDIAISARGLSPDAPHAVHIHYGDQARNECPTMGEATNTRTDGTPRLSTSDGAPAYGPIVVSLTTSGDTTPDSALALDRFPVSTGGMLSYHRSNIEFTDVAGTGYAPTGTGTAKQIADAIRDGEGVVVVHGVDYNGNNEYDFDSAGASDLTSAASAEATDPTLCGVLAHKN